MKILGFKMVNGDDVFAEVIPYDEYGDSDSEKNYRVKNPVGMIVQPHPQTGQPTPGLADYLMFAEKKEVVFPKSAYMFTYEPSVNIINGYNKTFGSGLLIPNRPTLITG